MPLKDLSCGEAEKTLQCLSDSLWDPWQSLHVFVASLYLMAMVHRAPHSKKRPEVPGNLFIPFPLDQ
jgi:hypothetical protein